VNGPAPASALYRTFLFPLNVLTHILVTEEGDVPYLHYGLFERDDESIADAQQRSTDLLLARLPPPPGRLLEVGIGLGTTFARLRRLGYDAEGITPDPTQIAIARSRFAGELPLHAVGLEAFETSRPFDIVLFQESAQYVDSAVLFRKVAALAAPGASLVVLDEFALRPMDRPDALHGLDRFLASADSEGFRLEEQIDLSREAAPTIDYFLQRLSRHRASIVAEVGVSAEQLEGLIKSGREYRELYRSGAYGYRLLSFRKGAEASIGSLRAVDEN
jgi:SAM-dependent methyltransferase